MPLPLLLILDGESLRTPELERSFADGGWSVDWTLVTGNLASKAENSETGMVMLDPERSGEAAVQAITALRNRRPDLPVVVIQDDGAVSGIPGANVISRALPVAQWPGVLEGFLPRVQTGAKLTAEDLFGDILAEIESPVSETLAPKPSTPPVAAEAPRVPAPPRSPEPPKPVDHPHVLPTVHPAEAPHPSAPAHKTHTTAPVPTLVQVPLSHPTVNRNVHPQTPGRSVTTIQAPIIRAPMVHTVTSPAKSAKKSKDLSTAPVPIPSFASKTSSSGTAHPAPEAKPVHAPSPVTAPTPVPAPILPELFGDLLGPLVETPESKSSSPKLMSDFTLSGFSGIHDPFDVSLDSVAPQKDTALKPTHPKSALPKPAAQDPGPAKPASGTEAGSLELEFLSTDPTPAERSLVKPPHRVVTSPEPDAGLAVGDVPLEEFGNYYLLEKIAVGGMAELFKARQRGVHNFEKIVAIKRILPHLSDNDEFVRMFIDEAKLAAQLTHPNIVQIFDLGKASGFYYIAMEYVDGKDLRSLLRKVREYRIPVPEPVAAFVTMKVAMALDYAHRKRGMNDKELKLVHRDVSPQNVLIGNEGAVKLVDFGIAKAATKSTQTMAGALKGKLLYMSPEQALGGPLDNRSDIYSLGLVLFELLTGERCFQADSELGVLEKVRLGKVQDVRMVNPAVSQDMARVLEKALQKNVDQRYVSARFMERDLKALLVKHGNEPTDHDVAEYANTLLKGTKEQLEQLLAERFAVREVPTLPTAEAKPLLEDQPTRADIPKAAPKNVPQMLPPPPELGEEPSEGTKHRWVLPVLLGVALVLAVTTFLILKP